MSDPKDPPRPPAALAESQPPSLAELIAQTPGAQTRDQALAHIAAREHKLSTRKPKHQSSEEATSKPEPFSLIGDPDRYAADFHERWEKAAAAAKEKEKAKKRPPRRTKPRVVVDNDAPEPSDKK